MSFLKSEFFELKNILFDLLSNASWLVNPRYFRTKIYNLTKAKECGLEVPNSLLSSDISGLKGFFSNNGNMLVTKPIRDSSFIEDEKKLTYPLFTSLISDISNIPTTFYPSFFQELVEKEFEIRSFYLDKKIWSMALFSQKNENTQIDFRKDDFKNPIRRVPFNLPKKIEEKIRKLMLLLNLNSGSIDILKTHDDRYVFLEINPGGQFNMISNPCNYNLHKKVAEYLTGLVI